MFSAFNPDFEPFAKEGQLLALQGLGQLLPTRFARVVQIEPIPEILITIAASASDERQVNLEVSDGELVQWRFRVVAANAQVVVKSPQSVRSYGTGGGGQGFVAVETDTDWGTVNDRALTEFFFLGGENREIRFDELSGNAATASRFAGWKHYVEMGVTAWTQRDPANLGRLIDVDPTKVPSSQIHLLENFAGTVPLFLTRG